MEKRPRISVVMPVYNSQEYLDEAISSILAQTYTDFEFLIFNDGSTDRSREIIEAYAKKDLRIKFYNQENNSGYVPLLNKGIRISQGDFVARMDSDDISLPTRFEKQIKYMDTHPEVAVLGTSCYAIKGKGAPEKGWILRATPNETRVHFLFTNYILHPSTMLRKSGLPNPVYRQEYMPAEDFDLWTRILDSHQIFTLSEPLLIYRQHDSSISAQRKEFSYRIASDILESQLRKLGVQPTAEEIEIHHATSDFVAENIPLERIKDWFSKIWQANKQTRFYDEHILLSTMLGRWFILCRMSKTTTFIKKTTTFLSLVWNLMTTLGVMNFLQFIALSGRRIVRYIYS